MLLRQRRVRPIGSSSEELYSQRSQYPGEQDSDVPQRYFDASSFNYAFCIVKKSRDWIDRSGFIPPTGLVIGLAVALPLVGMVLLMVLGKKLRRWTKNSKYHEMI